MLKRFYPILVVNLKFWWYINKKNRILEKYKAILKKSKEIAFKALLLDPTINNASKAEEIFDEMIKINEEYFILN